MNYCELKGKCCCGGDTYCESIVDRWIRRAMIVGFASGAITVAVASAIFWVIR